MKLLSRNHDFLLKCLESLQIDWIERPWQRWYLVGGDSIQKGVHPSVCPWSEGKNSAALLAILLHMGYGNVYRGRKCFPARWCPETVGFLVRISFFLPLTPRAEHWECTVCPRHCKHCCLLEQDPWKVLCLAQTPHSAVTNGSGPLQQCFLTAVPRSLLGGRICSRSLKIGLRLGF